MFYAAAPARTEFPDSLVGGHLRAPVRALELTNYIVCLSLLNACGVSGSGGAQTVVSVTTRRCEAIQVANGSLWLVASLKLLLRKFGPTDVCDMSVPPEDMR